MGLFNKGPSRDDIISQGLADAEAEAAQGDKKEGPELNTGNEKVDLELTKVYAQLESFGEIRKANAERFSRTSEQIGELRGMIVDVNKAMSKVEVAATKAVDLVESVKPEKLMIEVRKQDGKIEALRANIEGNESIMKDLMAELKKVRDQMSFYKGTEQVIQMNEEVKQELASMKRMEAVIERHADKVETIFLEVQKKFTEFDKFDGIVKDLQAEGKKLALDFDKIRVKLDTKEDKKEFVTLVDKFNDFEKHTTNLLKLLDERSKTVKDELEKSFSKMKMKIERQLKLPPIDLEAADEAEPAPKKTGGVLKKFNPFGKKVVEKGLDGDAPEEAAKPEAKESGAKEPGAEESAAEGSGTGEPGAKEADDGAAPEPAASEPVAPEPASSEPASSEPAGEPATPPPANSPASPPADSPAETPTQGDAPPPAEEKPPGQQPV